MMQEVWSLIILFCRVLLGGVGLLKLWHFQLGYVCVSSDVQQQKLCAYIYISLNMKHVN